MKPHTTWEFKLFPTRFMVEFLWPQYSTRREHEYIVKRKARRIDSCRWRTANQISFDLPFPTKDKRASYLSNSICKHISSMQKTHESPPGEIWKAVRHAQHLIHPVKFLICSLLEATSNLKPVVHNSHIIFKPQQYLTLPATYRQTLALLFFNCNSQQKGTRVCSSSITNN